HPRQLLQRPRQPLHPLTDLPPLLFPLRGAGVLGGRRRGGELLLQLGDPAAQGGVLFVERMNPLRRGVDFALQSAQPVRCLSRFLSHQPLHPKRRSSSVVRAPCRSLTSSWVRERSWEL